MQGGDVSIASLVKLLIIDEVHLLNDDRGPVIETLVARTQRQVRLGAHPAAGGMGSSVFAGAFCWWMGDAWLNRNGVFDCEVLAAVICSPCHERHATTECAMQGPGSGQHGRLWYPASMCATTIRALLPLTQVADSLKRGYQAMVFVHSRKDTGKTARTLADLAARNGDLALFDNRDHPMYGFAQKDVKKSRWGCEGCTQPQVVLYLASNKKWKQCQPLSMAGSLSKAHDKAAVVWKGGSASASQLTCNTGFWMVHSCSTVTSPSASETMLPVSSPPLFPCNFLLARSSCAQQLWPGV
eukprot:scaffold37118_cov18-Tisochrysis_lutea.AAC.4